MITQRSLSEVMSVVDKSGAVLLLSAGIALIALIGCSSSHSLEIYGPQPVYFGNVTQSALPLDTAHVRFIRPILVGTSHVKEKEKVVQGKSSTFTKEGSEGVVGDAVLQVKDALGENPDRFIGNAEIRARVEAYVPWDSIISELLMGIFSGESKSEGLGEASRETMELSGTVYNVRRTNQ
jgi:hypothetical protein